jgi:myo-inositol-1(or 4)-monophosphatase
MNREKLLKDIVTLAGKRALKFFKRDISLIFLRGQSKEIVTKYDKLLDTLIITQIKKNFPKDSILTEESGYLKGKEKDNLWIVDSLDGSGNFANFNPLFSISVAFYKKRKPLLGVVFAPALNEFYFAKKGKGAFLNGKRIEVSKIKKLNQAYLVYCEGSEKNRERFSKILSKVYPQVKDIRKIGSAGIECCWVAAGRVDGYFTTQIEIWDVAAGILIVNEAGGKVTDFQGKKWKLQKQDLLFTNSILHKPLISLLSKKQK